MAMGEEPQLADPGRAPRRGGRRPTIGDVARLAGVSAMTVSRVINNDAKVLPATRDKVQAGIAALGYVPNPAARSLAGARQCRIALLHSNPSAAYLSEFLMGSLAEAGASHALLQVEPYIESESAEALARRLAEHRTDAVLLPPPLSDNLDLIAALDAAGLVLAQIATGRPSPIAQAVTIDDEAAAHAMTAHLIGMGHRRIGFIAGHPNQTASDLRSEGYRRALRDAGIDPAPDLVAQGDFTCRSGLNAAESLLLRAVRPTAIFASNDDMAAATIAVAHRRRLDVPNDLTVCGFDDTAIATTIWPELTTIRQPIGAMSGQATCLLVAEVQRRTMGEGGGVRHVRLPFELVRRVSDSPPGSAS
jgi:LacI family transcriptional regulator